MPGGQNRPLLVNFLFSHIYVAQEFVFFPTKAKREVLTLRDYVAHGMLMLFLRSKLGSQ